MAFQIYLFLLSGQFSGCLRARLRILRVQRFASIRYKDSAVMADGQITYTSTAKMGEKNVSNLRSKIWPTLPRKFMDYSSFLSTAMDTIR